MVDDKKTAKKPVAKKATKATAKKTVSKAKTTLVVEQIGSPIGRRRDQRQTLIGLGLNKMHRRSELEDTASVRGMIDKIKHLVNIVEEKKAS